MRIVGRHAPGIAVVAAALVLLAPGAARAYVRSTTEGNVPVFWQSGCTWIFADIAGTPDLDFDTVQATLTRAIANWQSVTTDTGCSYLRILTDPPAAGEAKLDHANVLKFRTDKWCRPAEPGRAEDCTYSSAATAITTVFYTNHPGNEDDGAILDADIQMNDIDFTFVVVGADGKVPVPRKGTSAADLENTLTHELGHFQGLDHTCWDKSPPHVNTPPIDDTGAAIPACTEVSQPSFPQVKKTRIVEATMYNYADPGETKKRSVYSDDIAGICGIYPLARSPNTCDRVKVSQSTGCAVGARGVPPTSRTPLVATLAGLLAWMALRSRRPLRVRAGRRRGAAAR